MPGSGDGYELWSQVCYRTFYQKSVMTRMMMMMMAVCRGKRISVTHFEFYLNDKIGGSEGETTPEPSLV